MSAQAPLIINEFGQPILTFIPVNNRGMLGINIEIDAEWVGREGAFVRLQDSEVTDLLAWVKELVDNR